MAARQQHDILRTDIYYHIPQDKYYHFVFILRFNKIQFIVPTYDIKIHV